MNVVYNLPDGSTTKDPERLEREWKAFYGPLEDALGVRVMGFDAGLLLCDVESANGPAFTMPMWMARRVIKAVSPRECFCACGTELTLCATCAVSDWIRDSNP